MKKIFFLFILGLTLSTPSVLAQNVVSTKAHKVVFQLTNNDTLAHKALVRQINNLLTAAPNAQIEVVCHNNGIEFLTAAKTKQAKGITELKAKGVVFAACENTLRERKIEKTEIVSEAIFVPAGVLEVVMKQEDGYSYLKAGF
ncbi:MAG: DsrE family protein [Saprospiraceae bacterium]|nr:DsrE family protein [Saprospiraceae bacterium]